MARRGLGGGMTALRAALGAVSGGLEGARIQEAAEAEKKRMADALARQTRMDTAAQEDRAEAKADRLRSQRQSLLAKGYVRDGMDMPGATPRTPVNTEMVDGERYSVYETERQQALRSAIEAAQLKEKSASGPSLRYTEGETGMNVFNPKDMTSTYTPYAAGFVPKKPAERSDIDDEQKRKLGLQYMASQARNPALMAALQTTFANDPEAAADPGIVAYDLMKSKMIRSDKGFEPPKPKVTGRAPRSGNAPPGAGGASASASQTETDDAALEAEYYRNNPKRK